MKHINDTYRLSNGIEIPCLGFGTWQMTQGEEAFNAVLTAIKQGYRHIDTAAAYGNEASVGKAIKASGIGRNEFFVTSKRSTRDNGYEATLAAFHKTMDLLGMDVLDLYLIHWPNPIAVRESWQAQNAGSWKAMEELYRAKKIRAIGVSNFHEHHLEALMQTAEIVPMVNQIRLCPGDTQDGLVNYCRQKDILLEAYSPLGTGLIFDVIELQEMANKYQKSIAQICIRWSLQMGFLPLPKTVTKSRIVENAAVFDFELLPDDVDIIAGLHGCCGYSTDPDTITW